MCLHRENAVSDCVQCLIFISLQLRSLNFKFWLDKFWVALGFFFLSLTTPGRQVGIFIATYLEQYSFPLYSNRRGLSFPKLVHKYPGKLF